jgi:hypothetical protein
MRPILLIIAALTLCACNPRLIPLPDPTRIVPSPVSSPLIVTPAAETDRIIALVVADLSARLSPDPAQVRLVSIESVSWPDASLGCPQPGQSYAEIIVPGYRIILEVGRHEYPYHTDTRDNFILCPRGGSPFFPPTPGDTRLAVLADGGAEGQ